MASLTTPNFEVGPNNRPICRTIGCEKEAKPNCAAQGYCTYSCSLLTEKRVVDASELPPCALFSCSAYVKTAKPQWKPFCSWSCQEKFEQLLAEIDNYDGASMTCPLCEGGWTFYTCDRYSAAKWMSWHLTEDHNPDDDKKSFVENVQVACQTWFPKDDTPTENSSLLKWYKVKQDSGKAKT